MRPEPLSLKSAAVKAAAPLVVPSAAAFCIASTPPVKVSGEEMVVLVTFPVASVRSKEFGRVETISAEVEAVVAERYVEEAYVVRS
jgi:hypothetical protein